LYFRAIKHCFIMPIFPWMSPSNINCAFSCILADVKSALHKKRSDGKKAPLQKLTTMQKVYISRLILKHGDNYVVRFHPESNLCLVWISCFWIIVVALSTIVLSLATVSLFLVITGVVKRGSLIPRIFRRQCQRTWSWIGCSTHLERFRFYVSDSISTRNWPTTLKHKIMLNNKRSFALWIILHWRIYQHENCLSWDLFTFGDVVWVWFQRTLNGMKL